MYCWKKAMNGRKNHRYMPSEHAEASMYRCTEEMLAGDQLGRLSKFDMGVDKLSEELISR